MLQVPGRDQLALGMRGEPPLPVAQQLLHLVLRDPVVLFIVEHGHQNIEVAKQLTESLRRAQCHAEVAALAPFRKLGVERLRLGHNGVTEGLEEPAQESFATAAG